MRRLPRGANLSNADLSTANLVDAIYNGGTLLPTGFDPVAAGMIYSTVPEPSTALLIGLGLIGLRTRRRDMDGI